jgi:hypothetical protein
MSTAPALYGPLGPHCCPPKSHLHSIHFFLPLQYMGNSTPLTQSHSLHRHNVNAGGMGVSYNIEITQQSGHSIVINLSSVSAKLADFIWFITIQITTLPCHFNIQGGPKVHGNLRALFIKCIYLFSINYGTCLLL